MNFIYVRVYLLLLFIHLVLMGCNDDSKKEARLGHINHKPLVIKEVQFFSNSLQREMTINVILPRDYEETDLSYPVLYLCHGLTSNFHEFEYVGVPEYLNRFDMIVVMVDVGNSWYVNWAKSDGNEHNNFADHVTKDIINYIDSNYRTVADRKGRAINGISMGGFGAMSLGLTHPELFCSIASHSGALKWAAEQKERMKKGNNPWVIWPQAYEDTVTRYRDINIKGYSTLKDRTPKGQPFLKPEEADAVDPFKLVLQIPKEKLPHIYIDCGTEDHLITAAQEFTKLLMEYKIPFNYGQSEGLHEEDYWGRELSTSMAVQYSMMLRNISGKVFERYDAYNK